MKLPRLKYYYYAMSEPDYDEFARTRQLTVSPQLTIDVATGRVTGRTMLVLASSTAVIDDHFRAAHRWQAPVMVLRIPRDLIDRRHLVRAAPELYEYRASITIPHCGVERIELQPH